MLSKIRFFIYSQLQISTGIFWQGGSAKINVSNRDTYDVYLTKFESYQSQAPLLLQDNFAVSHHGCRFIKQMDSVEKRLQVSQAQYTLLTRA